MKKIISILLVLCLALSLVACGGSGTAGSVGANGADDFVAKEIEGNPTVMGTFYRNVIGAKIASDDPDVKELDKKADEKLKQIEEYPDKIEVTGKIYYVSNDGDDKADGLSPETAKRSYLSFKGQLKEGDAVLFRRGDIFRGQMVLISGITYGAYGTGIKPRFYGSSDGTEGEWQPTETQGVYTYSKPVKYANIIFNNGEAIGRPVEKMEHITKKAHNVYYDGSRVSVYCPKGNPKEVYQSIEIVADYCLFVGGGGFKNVKLQNLCLMYTGVHFLGTLGEVHGLEVEGCIMGYCGGRDLYKPGVVSLGNSIEFWSVAVDIDIHDSYFFQAYDAALTHQGPTSVAKSGQTSSTNYTNIKYRDNLLEYNTYDFEAFSCRSVAEQSKNPNGTFTYNDVYITGNICRFTGWGWGSLDRPDKNVYTTFKYDAQGENDTNVHVKPLYIENNIFDRSRKGILGIQTPDWNKANMILKNNQFLETSTAKILGSKTLKDDYMSEINKYFTAEGNTFKIVQ